jgi:hypothetical protein
MDVTHAYIGRCRTCDAVLAIRVDKGDKDTAQWLKETALSGLAIERKTIEAARKHGLDDCECGPEENTL